MKESLVSDRNPLVSILFILLVILIGFLFIGPIVGLAVSSLFYEGNLLVDIQQANPDPKIVLPLMVTQGITSLLGLIVLPVLYLKFIEHRSLVPFFKQESDWLKTIGMIVLLGLCFVIAISPIVEWNMKVEFSGLLEGFGNWAREQEDKLMEMTKLITGFTSASDFTIGLIVIAILPGIGEELVFRGLIQNELYRSSKNIHAAIWASAILFSAIHMQFFGFIPRMLLGAVFGYLYYWSGNLFVPMIAHFFHNGFTLTMIYLYNLKVVNVNIDSEESAPIPLVATCAIFTFALLYFLRKQFLSTEQPSL